MSENVALIGADPELFVSGTVKDNRGRPLRYDIIPAFGLFGGSKDEPKPMADLGDGYMYLEDNAALEFNIPPQRTARDFVDAINNAKRWLGANLIQNKGMEFSDSNYLELQPQYMHDPRAQEVGCMPDHDAYNDGAKRDPFNAEKLGSHRYAGGHIHLSYNCKVVPQYVAVRFLDLFLSLPWLEYDRQQMRRQTYGKAGLFRPKDYGVEYRTLSNWWLFMGEGVQQSLAESALTFARRTYEPDFLRSLSDAFVGMPWDDVQKCIAGEDYRLASQLIELGDRNYNLGIRGRGQRRR